MANFKRGGEKNISWGTEQNFLNQLKYIIISSYCKNNVLCSVSLIHHNDDVFICDTIQDLLYLPWLNDKDVETFNSSYVYIGRILHGSTHQINGCMRGQGRKPTSTELLAWYTWAHTNELCHSFPCMASLNLMCNVTHSHPGTMTNMHYYF